MDLNQILETLRVAQLPMRSKFRGITTREVALFEGPAGWGEFSPFLEYVDIESANWLKSAVEAATVNNFPSYRSSIKINGTIPATDSAEEIEKLSGGTTFRLEDLRDPELNIRYGTFYLAHLIEMYDGDLVAALAAYNAGPGNADEWGGASMTIEDITFPETEAYVKKVLEKQREYKHEYSLELGY